MMKMKSLSIAALLVAQTLACAQPAFAAELTDSPQQQAGVFGGVRLRVPLDGGAERRQVRAGLAVAPTLHSRTRDGETRLRMGEGIELGVSERESLRLTIGGQDARRLLAAAQNQNDGEEDDDDFNVGHAALIVGGVILVAAAGLFLLAEIVDDRSE
jgi:hypothetical protein